jgi:hypothetical protein
MSRASDAVFWRAAPELKENSVAVLMIAEVPNLAPEIVPNRAYSPIHTVFTK